MKTEGDTVMLTDEKGNKWYKGNLHTHTSLSDGRLSPDEVISMYRRGGYDFLALTDHWKLSETIEDKDFLLLSGCEYDTGQNAKAGIYHIVGIGMQEAPCVKKEPGLAPQEIVNTIRKAGGIAILAHPAWSMNRPESLLRLEGLAGTEIYNTVSGKPWNVRPYSGWFVDALAVDGKEVPCFASDDAHFYNGDQMKSYIMVRADSLTRESILSSIRRGDFYATQSPELYVSRVDDVIHVRCSPVSEVIFFSDTVYAEDRVVTGSGIREALYRIKPSDTFLRVELVDANGRMAWSSPIGI